MLLLASGSAIAAPVGTLTCSHGATANLSYYQIASKQAASTGTTGSGPGAGRLDLMPLTVHAALSQFQAFYYPFLRREFLPSCVLTSSVAGQSFKIEFDDVEIVSFNATAANNSTASGGEEEASAYIEFTLAYKSIKIDSKGPDDGGSAPRARTLP